MEHTCDTLTDSTTLKVGAGIGRILLPMDYFIITNPDGSITYEDGFNGLVHTFPGAKGEITDDPCIRVLLLENGVRAAIVAMEIAQAPEDQIAYTKAIVSRLCAVDEKNIWVHSTHQFGFMHRPANTQQAACYDEAMKRAVTEAAKEAVSSLQDAVLGVGTGICNVSANRNIPTPDGVEGGPYSGLGSKLDTNKTMTILRFDSLDNTPIAFFLSYGTKPSALCITGKNVGNRELNSEVPGHAAKLVEEEFGVPCLFCMPAAADQYPRETAQFHAFDENGVWRKMDLGFETGIQIVDRLGDEMGLDAIRIAKGITCSAADSKISLAATEFPYPNKTEDGEIMVSAQVLTLGDIAFVGFKQEMDCITERQIQAASPYGTTLLVSFLNGDGKYFGHLEAYDFNHGLGTCETARSPFAKGAAEKFVCVATNLLNAMQQGEHIDTLSAAAERSSGVSPEDTVEFAGHTWIVLDKQDGKTLVVSRDILEQQPYHTVSENITWEQCSLRQYLNGTWLDSALNEAEKAMVTEASVENPSNPKYGIRGGKATTDKVFLLSLQEVDRYLAGNTDLLMAKNMESGELAWWHLRSPGEASYVAASVTSGGLIDYHGTAADVTDATGGVRPAMWLKLD